MYNMYQCQQVCSAGLQVKDDDQSSIEEMKQNLVKKLTECIDSRFFEADEGLNRLLKACCITDFRTWPTELQENGK